MAQGSVPKREILMLLRRVSYSVDVSGKNTRTWILRKLLRVK